MYGKSPTPFILGMVVLLAGILAAGAGAAGAAGTSYSIQGHYYETCSCTVSCPCAPNATMPTEGHCDAVSVYHIEHGQVGSVKLDGLTLAHVFRTAHGMKTQDAMMKGKVDPLTLYADAKATPAQREALNRLTPVIFPMGDKFGKVAQWVPMELKVNGDDATFTIDGGKTLTFETHNIVVGETKLGQKITSANRVVLTNTAPFPWIKEMSQGISKQFHYSAGNTSWDYKERNAFFGTISAKGTIGSAAPAAKASR